MSASQNMNSHELRSRCTRQIAQTHFYIAAPILDDRLRIGIKQTLETQFKDFPSSPPKHPVSIEEYCSTLSMSANITCAAVGPLPEAEIFIWKMGFSQVAAAFVLWGELSVQIPV